MQEVKIMLMMYCCSSPECGNTFVRTDERTESKLSECPKCGNKTFFRCDFRSWTGSSEEEQEDLREPADELSEALRLLNLGVVKKVDYLKDLKGRMMLYHNELWKILVGNEPEKYRQCCPPHLR